MFSSFLVCGWWWGTVACLWALVLAGIVSFGHIIQTISNAVCEVWLIVCNVYTMCLSLLGGKLRTHLNTLQRRIVVVKSFKFSKLLKAWLKLFHRDVSERENSSRTALNLIRKSVLPDLTTSILSSVYFFNKLYISILQRSISACHCSSVLLRFRLQNSDFFFRYQVIQVSKVSKAKWSDSDQRPRAAWRLQADFKGNVYRN